MLFIANIAFITKETNNKRLNDKNPSVYMKELLDEKCKNGQEEEFYKYLETHFITKDMVNYLLEDDFENFIIMRTKKIYEYIQTIV